LSDDEAALYNSWKRVMGEAERNLLCTWHVLRNWNKKVVCVKDKSLRDELSSRLRNLIMELEIPTFESMLSSLLSWLTHVDLAEFHEYFTSHYTHRKEVWAHCYRLHAGINTNMSLERMHGTIKHHYLNSKTTKGMDVSFSALLKYLRTKIVDRVITNYRANLTTKARYSRIRHKSSLSVSTSLVTPINDEWVVHSFSQPWRTYTVNRIKDECECNLFCHDCNTCIHMFLCSCADNSIKSNMCKHIHLLSRFLKEKGNPNEDLSDIEFNDYDLVINTSLETEARQKELRAHVKELAGCEQPEAEYDVQEARGNFETALALVETKAEFKIVNDSLKNALSLLRSHKSSTASSMVRLSCALSQQTQKLICKFDLTRRLKTVSRKSITELLQILDNLN